MRTYSLCLLLFLLLPSMLLADAADDFIGLGTKMRQSIQNPFAEDATVTGDLTGEETRLSEALCQSPELLTKVFLAANRLPPDLIHILLERIRFRVHQEHQTDLLKFIPEEFAHQVHSGTVVPAAEKPDLTRGSWKETPDGRSFWVSDQNPDVILSPAEYQRLLAAEQD